MQRPNLYTKPRHIAGRENPKRWFATNPYPEPGLRREIPPPGAIRSSAATADAAVEFGRLRLLLRQRQLLADGVPVELGTRAFDLLVVLVEADGLLVTKEELLSCVWPSIVVSEENLKVQVSALRKALGADRDVIRTEVGRGYRFTGVPRTQTTTEGSLRPMRRRDRKSFLRDCRQFPRCSFRLS